MPRKPYVDTRFLQIPGKPLPARNASTSVSPIGFTVIRYGSAQVKRPGPPAHLNASVPLKDPMPKRDKLETINRFEAGTKVVLVTPANGATKFSKSRSNPYFDRSLLSDPSTDPVVGTVISGDDVSDRDLDLQIDWPSVGRNFYVYPFDTPDDQWELFTLEEFLAMRGSGAKNGEPPVFLPEELDKVKLAPEARRSILAVLRQHRDSPKIFDEWGLSETVGYGRGMTMLFWGPPGTGKTWATHCIAKTLGKKLRVLDNAKLQSPVPGEMERNLKAEFDKAGKEGSVLLLDECDSLLMSRSGGMGMISSSHVNALLTEIEKFDGVVVLTTNRVGELDKALERRISLIVEFPVPDQETRLEIWKGLIPSRMPLADDVDLAKLAETRLTGGLIKNVVLNAARLASGDGCDKVALAHFERAVEMSAEGNAAFRKKSSVLHGQAAGGFARRIERELLT